MCYRCVVTVFSQTDEKKTFQSISYFVHLKATFDVSAHVVLKNIRYYVKIYKINVIKPA